MSKSKFSRGECPEFPGVGIEYLRVLMLKYRGDGRLLEAAIGAWFLGTLVGGRGLELMHSRPVLERYGRICGFGSWRAMRDSLPASGPMTENLPLLKLRRRFQEIFDAVGIERREIRVSV